MLSVTFRIGDETLRRARIRAHEQGTSLNAVVEELLVAWATEGEYAARRRLIVLAEREGVVADLDERGWTRHDLQEVSTQRDRIAEELRSFARGHAGTDLDLGE